MTIEIHNGGKTPIIFGLNREFHGTLPNGTRVTLTALQQGEGFTIEEALVTREPPFRVLSGSAYQLTDGVIAVGS